MKRNRSKDVSPEKAADVPESPYVAGRREWMERYGDYIKQATTWRKVAIGALAIAFVAVAGITYIGSQSRFVPYVIEVNKLGDAVATHPAMVAAQPDQRVIQAELARWVVNVRSVYVDAYAQRSMLDDAYFLVVNGGAAYTTLNDWYRDHNPFDVAKKNTVAIKIDAPPMPVSKDSWQVQWTETVRDRSGGLISSKPWSAIITIAVHSPSSQAAILQNPMGIYIQQFTWSPRL